MEMFFYIFLVLIIIISLVALVYLNIYNKIQKIKIRIDESETIIDDMLRTRYDLVSRINNIIINVLNHNYLKEIDDLRNKKISNFEMDRKITDGLNLYEKIKNDHKELSDNDKLKEIDMELKFNNERLEAAKAYFNIQTSLLNKAIKTFPSMLIARIHNIKVRNYFDGKNLNDDDINDFKV